MRQVPNSELRHRILTALNYEPASSVTALARRLGALRPSVSRAVNSLLEAGLVTRQGRVLILNEAGQEELKRLDAALTGRIRKSTDIYTRILAQAIPIGKQTEALINSHGMRAIHVFDTNLISQVGKVLDPGIIQQAKQVHEVGKALSALGAFHTGAIQQAVKDLDTSYIQHIKEAIKATAFIQTINLDLLRSWDQTMSSHLILDNNAFLSSMMIDLEAIAKIGTIVDHTTENLINQTTWTTEAYLAYFQDCANSIRQKPAVESLEMFLTVPTTTTASLVGSTRSIVETHIISQAEDKPDETTRVSVYTEQYAATAVRLEGYLRPLGEHFIDKWEGAWQTLYSDSKDRYSQATHSGRELLMQVLSHLAPDDAFLKEDFLEHNSKPTRKLRVKHILGSNSQVTIELIDSMANMLDSMYNILVGETHRRDGKHREDDTVAGLLIALGGILTMLLSMRGNNQT